MSCFFFFFFIPSGFKLLLEVFSVIHGPQEECVKALRSGHLLGISPGGVREALFSDETYTLLWGKRKGFAQVAIDSKVVRYRKHVLESENCISTFSDPLKSHCFASFLSLQPIIPMFTQNVREGFRSLGNLSKSCVRSFYNSTQCNEFSILLMNHKCPLQDFLDGCMRGFVSRSRLSTEDSRSNSALT